MSDLAPLNTSAKYVKLRKRFKESYKIGKWVFERRQSIPLMYFDFCF